MLHAAKNRCIHTQNIIILSHTGPERMVTVSSCSLRSVDGASGSSFPIEGGSDSENNGGGVGSHQNGSHQNGDTSVAIGGAGQNGGENEGLSGSGAQNEGTASQEAEPGTLAAGVCVVCACVLMECDC